VEWVETTGRTVHEAVDAALDQLGVDEQEADVQVLEEPQTGLFGRLRVEARVRVRVRPKRPRAKVDGRPRRRRSGRKDVPATPGDQPEQGGRSRSEGSHDATTSGLNSDGRRRRRQRRTQQQGAHVSEDGDSKSTVPDAAGGPDSTDTTSGAIDVEPQRETVEGFLRGLTAAFGRPEVEVSAQIADDTTIVADVKGEDLGLLVGPKGQTLQAIHELTRSVVQRQFAGQTHARLQLDVGGYRERRKNALERFTRDIAEEVLSSGRAKVLDPMSAADRKVVHDVVNAMDGVRTLSEGEEPRRRVVIELADAGSSCGSPR
jgi:spoIIIJ-associated protein